MSGEVQAAWVEAIGRLPHARAFRVAHWQFDEADDLTSLEDPLLEIVVRETLQQDYIEDADRETSHGLYRMAAGLKWRGMFAGPLGDQLFGIVMRALTEASVKPTHLDFWHDTTGLDRWEVPCGPEGALFNELESLLFRPRALVSHFDSGEYHNLDDDDNMISCAAGKSFRDILKASAARLRRLSIGGDCPLSVAAPPWWGKDHIALPDLRQLQLDRPVIDPCLSPNGYSTAPPSRLSSLVGRSYA